jgi:hypothetical protein
MQMVKRARLYIVIGFRGRLLRDTLAKSAKEAKRLCVKNLWENHPDYESERVRWSTIESWGWCCVPVTVSYRGYTRRPK